MFEDYKELVETKIDESINEYSIESDKKEDIENEIKCIDDYQKLQTELTTQKILCSVESTIGITLLVAAITVGGLNFLYLFVGFSLFKAIIHGASIKEIKKHINVNKYKEYLKLDKSVLNEIKNDLTKNVKIIDSKMTKIQEEFRKNSLILECINTIEEDTQKLINLSPEFNKLLLNYQNEKIDYSNINFDNSISETIDYTENSKKLIKKI